MAQDRMMRSAESKRRHNSEAGYPRGAETRARIILAALEAFGTHGFGGTSTRLLADKAGVTLPALQYYFDDKEGLYLACAAYIAEALASRLGPQIEKIAVRVADPTTSRRALRGLLDELLDNLADLFLGTHELEKWVLFIIREQAQPTKAFDIIYEHVMRKVAMSCAALIAQIVNRPSIDSEVRLCAAGLIGQIIFFRTGRTAVLRFLDWPDFDADRLATVKVMLRNHTTAALGELRKATRRTP